MTTASRQAESSANTMLGALLQEEMMRGATVRYENAQVIGRTSGTAPRHHHGQPARPRCVEVEYMPAYVAAVVEGD